MLLTERKHYGKVAMDLVFYLIQWLFALFCCRNGSQKFSEPAQDGHSHSDAISDAFSQIYSAIGHSLCKPGRVTSTGSDSACFQRQYQNASTRIQLAQISQDRLNYKALTSAIALVSCYRQEGDPDHSNIVCSIDPAITSSCVYPRFLKKENSFQKMQSAMVTAAWLFSSLINTQTEKQGILPCISYA